MRTLRKVSVGNERPEQPVRRVWTVAPLALLRAAFAILWAVAASVTPLRGQYAPLDIEFLDVGQGDAVLIRTPEGRIALVDGGPRPDIVSKLQHRGVDTIHLVVATHPHADHITGLVSVIENMPVRAFLGSGDPHTTQTYLDLLRALQRRANIVYGEAAEQEISLGGIQLSVLPLPPPTENLNNRSVSLVIRYGEFEALLTGDSEFEQLQFLLGRGAVPAVEVLKAPHHGADDGVSPSFLMATRPELVVISVGAGNGYGHPGPDALRAYAREGIVMRTDLHGDVLIRGSPDGSFKLVSNGGPAYPFEVRESVSDQAVSDRRWGLRQHQEGGE